MDYRSEKIPGTSYFFTLVTEHRRPLLIEHIRRLRTAFRHVRQKHPFHIDAIVLLPDHLHTIWTLPEGDSDYSTRWMQIKRKFIGGTTYQSRCAIWITNRMGEEAQHESMGRLRFAHPTHYTEGVMVALSVA